MSNFDEASRLLPGATPGQLEQIVAILKGWKIVETNEEKYMIDANGKKQGQYISKYRNGSVKETFMYKDSVKDGPHEHLLSNGAICCRSTYKNGKKEGICENFYANGRCAKKLLYRNGEMDGVQTHFYQNGNICEQITYKNDILNGPRTVFHENGHLNIKCSHLNGRNHGIFIRQDLNGSYTLTYYDNGNEVYSRAFK